MKAWELLDSPEKWCKGANALTSDGMEVSACDPRACRWCLEGALRKCYGSFDLKIQAVRDALNTHYVFEWNDAPERTFEEVRNALIAADV